MRLSDLHPVLHGSLDSGKARIEFDCPKHIGTGCRLAFFVGRVAHAAGSDGAMGDKRQIPVWAATGEFPNLSLNASLNFSAKTRDGTPTGDPCWHGLIVNGEIQ